MCTKFYHNRLGFVEDIIDMTNILVCFLVYSVLYKQTSTTSSQKSDIMTGLDRPTVNTSLSIHDSYSVRYRL